MLYCLSQDINTKTNPLVVVGTHLTFLALLPSLTRTPSQVKSRNHPVHVYTYFSFHPHFHQQQTFSACLCQTASPQTPLRPFQKLKRNCYCSTLLLKDLLCHVINNIIILLEKIFMHTCIQQLLHIGLCNQKKKVIFVYGLCPTHITRWTLRHLCIINQ